MNTDKLLNMLLEAIDYSFIQIDGSYDKTLTYPVIDKVQYIKEQVKKEVKEIGLEKEIESYFKGFGKFPSVGIDDCIDIAKHFFEFGMSVSNKQIEEKKI